MILLPGRAFALFRGKQILRGAERLLNFFRVRELFLLCLQRFQFPFREMRLFQPFPAGAVELLLVPCLCQALFQGGKLPFPLREGAPGLLALFSQVRTSGPEVQRLHAEELVLQLQRLVLGMDIDQMGR